LKGYLRIGMGDYFYLGPRWEYFNALELESLVSKVVVLKNY